jgi:aminoglycoside phosphotransferase (APT) family kinase protein
MPLDPVSIGEELGLVRPRRPLVVHGGSDTVIWRVETDHGEAAVRVFRASQEHAAQREGEALAAAAAAGIPVPPVLAAGTPGSAGRRPVIILRWCEGSTMLDELIRRPGDAGSLGELLGRTQAAIHRAPVPREWRARPGERLLHLDLHPLNVLVDGHDVSAVLDWVNAQAGDPRADVARTYAILTADPAAVVFRRRDPMAARAFRQGWRTAYEGAAGPLGEVGAYIAEAGAWMRRDLAARHDAGSLDRIERWAAKWRSYVAREPNESGVSG